MASFNFNDTIKVSGAIAAQSNSGATLYTAPANGYAVIQATFYPGSGSTPTLSVGGRTVWQGNGGVGVQFMDNIHVGPGQAVVCAQGGPTTTIFEISGVQFSNSP